ncbi:MAG TPA: sulfotransferase [Alphaproteobacteria bacterium]|nr:sulfotransferase [Alphaproteobacteria bacterium]
MPIPPLEREALLAEARRRTTGLEDFGDSWFLEPLQVMLDATHAEAQLSAAGEAMEAERIIKCLMNRLRLIEAIRAHPEILDEKVTVAAAILGLSRTGSTKTHRMLCAAPSFTGMNWWEAQFPCPFEGEERGRPVARRAAAQQLFDLWLKLMPEIMSIHPMSLDQPEEEAILMDQQFVGTMVECFVWVPSYAKWLETADQTKAYQDLLLSLKYLQWQNPARAGKAWILKTPSHLSAPQTLLETFPGSVIVMTHRDPLRTIPSYCSMNATLMRMKSERVPLKQLGPFISGRWSWMLNNLIALRERIGDTRFVDLHYQDLVGRPMEQARKVFAKMNRPLTVADEAALQTWLDANPRDKRPPHVYDLDTYGLTEELLKRDFAKYRAKYL